MRPETPPPGRPPQAPPRRNAGRRPRRGLRWLLALLLLLPLAAAALLWGGSAWIGRTPAELLAYAEREAEASGTACGALAAPALHALRGLGADEAVAAQASPFVVPPLPPNPLRARPNGAAASAALATSSASAGPAPLSSAPAAGADPATDAAAGGGRLIQVGPQREIRSISLAAATARDGDTVEIDPGDYVGDVAVWSQADLTIRAAGQRVRLVAGGASAQGKAIWVVHSARRGGRITIEGIDFVGARVPDGNGAGIRFEQGHLVVRDCLFHGNQNGILSGDDPGSVLEVLRTEFAYNGAGDGLTHHLYVGRIALLRVEASWFHHANVGHLVKSRAARSRILYNRLTDEPGGRASYELEFPNGGDALVLGNLVQQSDTTANSVMVSYGSEGLDWPLNQLHLAFNTLVNDLPGGGSFVQVAPATPGASGTPGTQSAPGAQTAPAAPTVVVQDNLLVGRGRLRLGDGATEARNPVLQWADLARPGREDYRLSAAGRAHVAPVDVAGRPPEQVPRFEYRHPLALAPLAGPPRWPGALQTEGP